MKAPRGAFIRSALMEFYSGTPTENLSGVDNPNNPDLQQLIDPQASIRTSLEKHLDPQGVPPVAGAGPSSSRALDPPQPIRNAALAGKPHPVTGIPFNADGYPDFSGVAKKNVMITFSGDRHKDVDAENKAACYKETQ